MQARAMPESQECFCSVEERAASQAHIAALSLLLLSILTLHHDDRTVWVRPRQPCQQHQNEAQSTGNPSRLIDTKPLRHRVYDRPTQTTPGCNMRFEQQSR